MLGSDDVERLPLLVAHSTERLCLELRTLLAPIEVHWVRDVVAAASTVAAVRFRAVILEHPLSGMDAPDVVNWLRQCGATCRIVVVADGADDAAQSDLARSVGDDATIVSAADCTAIGAALDLEVAEEGGASLDKGKEPEVSPVVSVGEERNRHPAPSAKLLVRDSVQAKLDALVGSLERRSRPKDSSRKQDKLAAPAAKPPSPQPVSEPPLRDQPELPGSAEEVRAQPASSPAIASRDRTKSNLVLLSQEEAVEYLGKIAGKRLALEVDERSCRRWVMLDLPPRLIGLLDGSRTAAQLLTEAGLPDDELATYLKVLDELQCLELTAVVAEEKASSQEAQTSPQAPWIPQEPQRSPDISGSIAESSLPEFLLRLRQHRETGQLFLQGPGWTARIDVTEGDPTRASGGPAGTALGELLVRLGYLDQTGLDRLLAEQRQLVEAHQHLLLGEVALRLNLADFQQVSGALAEQIDAMIHALIALDQGPFRFYRGEGFRAPLAPKSRPIEWLIARHLFEQGMRKLEIVEGFVKRSRGKGLMRTDEAGNLLARFRFGPNVERLLRLVDGRSLPEIVSASSFPELEAETTMFMLWAAGGIRLCQSKTAAVPAPQPAFEEPAALGESPAESEPQPVHEERASAEAQPSSPVLEKSADGAVNTSRLLEEANVALAKRDYVRALRLLHEATSLDPEDATAVSALGWAVFSSQPGSERARSEARKLLERALNINAGEVNALVGMGKILRIDGDLKRARYFLQKALALDRRNEEASQELKNLDKVAGKDGDDQEPGKGGGLLGFFGRKVWG